MADLVARFDPGTGYVYVTSADEYPIPDDLWKLLQSEPYRAVYSHRHRGELRLSKISGDAAVSMMRADGHGVETTVSARPSRRATGPTGPMECKTCGQPYVTGKTAAPEERCVNRERTRDPATGERTSLHPPHLLVLVPPPSGGSGTRDQ